MDKQTKHLYEFDSFRIDATDRLLMRDGEPVGLPPKVFDLLLLLVENCGSVLDKDELMKNLWPDTFVEENNLTVNMSALRKALGENGNGHQYIQTIPKRGYRFAATVKELPNGEEEKIAEKREQSVVIESAAVIEEAQTARNGNE